MRKLIITGIVLLVGMAVFAIAFSIPAHYDVESFKQRSGTQYWNMEEGVDIGYYKLESSVSDKKEPIIYLHGGPGGRVSNEVIQRLSPLKHEGHDLYFYDQVGSGHSARLDKIALYSVDRHKEDLRKIIRKIGAHKVILIGQSWGACLAINYLQDYAETVHKIILTGPGPILPVNKSVVNEIPPDSLHLMEPEFSNKEGNEKVYTFRSKMIERWASLFKRKLVSDREADDFFTSLNQELQKSTDCQWKNSEKYPGGGGYYSHIMTVNSFNRVEDKRNQLKELKTPILILRGQCDNQKWGFTREYLDLFTHADLKIIEGAGHNILNKKSDEYLDLIRTFLTDKTHSLSNEN